MTQQNFAFLSFIHPIWSFILIVGLLVFWFFKKKLPSIKSFTRILNIFIVVILLQAFLETFLNWFLWSKAELTQRLIPPYAPVTYVIQYSWQHYLFEPIVTILFALIIFKIIALLNKKFNNTFFYDEEPYLAALGILSTGWPNCLLYLILVLSLGVIIHFLFRFNDFACLLKRSYRSADGLGPALKAGRRREMQRLISAGEMRPRFSEAGKQNQVFSKQLSEPFRLSLLHFWLPCVLLVLLLSGIISKYIGITQLII